MVIVLAYWQQGYRARLLRSIHVFLQRIAEEGKSVEPQRPFDEGSSPGASLQSTPELPHEDEAARSDLMMNVGYCVRTSFRVSELLFNFGGFYLCRSLVL